MYRATSMACHIRKPPPEATIAEAERRLEILESGGKPDDFPPCGPDWITRLWLPEGAACLSARDADRHYQLLVNGADPCLTCETNRHGGAVCHTRVYSVPSLWRRCGRRTGRPGPRSRR